MRKEIKAWLDAEERVKAATEEANRLRNEARTITPPSRDKVREAVGSDIREGAIIWYLDDEAYWQMVYEVLRPNDLFKAYTAEDGCRYGLEGAYVEIES